MASALPQALQRFETLDDRLSLGDYNFKHFRTKHYLADVRGTVAGRGVAPGEIAPDFELPRVDGGSIRLSDLRGKPVLLHFGSLT
jgi:AhpC/TSA family